MLDTVADCTLLLIDKCVENEFADISEDEDGNEDEDEDGNEDVIDAEFEEAA